MVEVVVVRGSTQGDQASSWPEATGARDFHGAHAQQCAGCLSSAMAIRLQCYGLFPATSTLGFRVVHKVRGT